MAKTSAIKRRLKYFRRLRAFIGSSVVIFALVGLLAASVSFWWEWKVLQHFFDGTALLVTSAFELVKICTLVVFPILRMSNAKFNSSLAKYNIVVLPLRWLLIIISITCSMALIAHSLEEPNLEDVKRLERNLAIETFEQELRDEKGRFNAESDRIMKRIEESAALLLELKTKLAPIENELNKLIETGESSIRNQYAERLKDAMEEATSAANIAFLERQAEEEAANVRRGPLYDKLLVKIEIAKAALASQKGDLQNTYAELEEAALKKYRTETRSNHQGLRTLKQQIEKLEGGSAETEATEGSADALREKLSKLESAHSKKTKGIESKKLKALDAVLKKDFSNDERARNQYVVRLLRLLSHPASYFGITRTGVDGYVIFSIIISIVISLVVEFSIMVSARAVVSSLEQPMALYSRLRLLDIEFNEKGVEFALESLHHMTSVETEIEKQTGDLDARKGGQ